MKKNDQRARTFSLGKYGWLYLYYIYFDKGYSIDDEYIHFVKGDGYNLIGNPDHPYVTSTDLFDRILEIDQNQDISLKVIHKDVSLPSINDNGTDSISNLRSRSEIISPFVDSRGK